VYDSGDLLYGLVTVDGRFVPARFVGFFPKELARIAELVSLAMLRHETNAARVSIQTVEA